MTIARVLGVLQSKGKKVKIRRDGQVHSLQSPFLTNPELIQTTPKALPMIDAHRNLQIVLETTVTDNAAGPPRILAVSAE